MGFHKKIVIKKKKLRRRDSQNVCLKRISNHIYKEFEYSGLLIVLKTKFAASTIPCTKFKYLGDILTLES